MKTLKKNGKGIDLMIGRMEEQSKILTEAYWEELDHTEVGPDLLRRMFFRVHLNLRGKYYMQIMASVDRRKLT